MIRVDRLVLDLPGMTIARAQRLSNAIGNQIGQGTALDSAEQVDVLLPPGAVTDEAILAALAAALRARVA